MISQITDNEPAVVRDVFERYIIAASITRDIEMDQYKRIKELEKNVSIQNDQIAVLTAIIMQLGTVLFMNGQLPQNIARSIRDTIFATTEKPPSESANIFLGILNQWTEQFSK